jgi:hypothetical protein
MYLINHLERGKQRRQRKRRLLLPEDLGQLPAGRNKYEALEHQEVDERKETVGETVHEGAGTENFHISVWVCSHFVVYMSSVFIFACI